LHGLKTRAIESDGDGVLPEALAQACEQYPVRVLYLTASAQNPDNTTMSFDRREALIAVVKQYRLLLIEDDVAAPYVRDRRDAFCNLIPEQVLYINSHSKTLAAGLRVGYLVYPASLSHRVASATRAQSWFICPLNAELAQRLLSHEKGVAVIEQQRLELARRQALARELLADFDCRFNAESFHVWMQLPGNLRAVAFTRRLALQGVSVQPAETFALDRFPAPQAIRICLTAVASIQDLEKGLRCVVDACQDPLEGDTVVF